MSCFDHRAERNVGRSGDHPRRALPRCFDGGRALAGAICGAVVLAPARWRIPHVANVIVPCVVGLCCVLIAVTPSL
ncbi:MAG: hypothetical protein EBZ45_00585 [Actinobacteria bacterium]|nr:hypothetical protein [Actinomycetota bacterium]